MRTRLLLAAVGAATIALVAACSTSGNNNTNGNSSTSGTTSTHEMSGMSSAMPGTSMSATNSDIGTGGMKMASGTGLSSTVIGYTLTLHSQLMTGLSMPLAFVITHKGQPVTDFDAEQTKLMHFYLIRDDLTGFQHLHPTMATDGTWSVTPDAVTAGGYRVYTQFVPHADASDGAIVLSRTTTVMGTAPSSSLPSPAITAGADGYTVSVDGTATANTDSQLKITVTRAGQPVSDLQPYLATYAHVTAFHEGDLAFAHLHPDRTATGTGGGGPTLTLHADLPEAGNYRVYIQFQTDGTLHTAPITLAAS